MRPYAAADGQRIEQRLGRMLVLAVAGIDDGAGNLLGQKFDGARALVPHHQDIGVHGVEGHGGVEQRFALGDRGGRDRHVHDIGAQALAGDFEGALGAGRGLEEQIDLGAACQHGVPLVDLAAHLDIAFGKVEEGHDLREETPSIPKRCWALRMARGRSGKVIKAGCVGGNARRGKGDFGGVDSGRT